MKKINDKISLLIVLSIAIITLSVVGVTYSKFIFQQDISNTINVPEYNFCLENGYETLSECIIASEYELLTSDEIVNKIKTKTVDTTNISSTDEGLYMMEDEYGESYYYRGAVVDNYVEFAGGIWRIIRINGDGTVRIIYSGNSVLDVGEATAIGKIAFNIEEITDMALLGYKYGLNQQSKSLKNIIYNDLRPEKLVTFSNKLTTNKSTKTYTLTDNVVSGAWSSMYIPALYWSGSTEEEITRKPKFTCWKESADSTCNIYMEVTGRTDGGTQETLPLEVTGNIYGFISKSYSDTLTNEYNSYIKEFLDDWYENYIDNVYDENGDAYSSYVGESYFCNDRALESGDGSSFSADTVYASYGRNTINKNPSLSCSATQNRFSKSTTVGNGNLSYPVGLITADELALSGVVDGIENSGSYLNTGISYWTMSPGYFSVSKLSENMYIMSSTGTLTTERIKNESYIRPVLNLKSDVFITQGNGTVGNPYKLGIILE